MKQIKKSGLAIIALLMSMGATAENEITNETVYKAEAFGSVATDENTPFWMVSNQYGKVPLNAGNGYLNAGVFHHQTFGKFYWTAGIDVVASFPRYKNVYIQQIYAELGYRCLLLTIGSKERYTSLWNRNLSSGDLIASPNARPIPEITLSIPEFQVIPFTGGWIQLKGEFSVGKSFDNDYLEKFTHNESYYVKDVLWHHKYGFIRIKDTKNDFPLSVTIGVRDVAQWGGTSTNPKFGEQPHSFKDFLRVVCGKGGNEEASISDQINVLGNHEITYDFKLGFEKESWQLFAYHQHYASDKSGLKFQNGTDGLWGIEFNSPFPWIKTVVTEFYNSRDQSGYFHMPIDTDFTNHPGCSTGADNYYNNGIYTNGLSYFNRGLGTPLVSSPEYNENGELGFKNNRIRAWHIGFEGNISEQVSYRLLFTFMNSWGTSRKPFLDNKAGTSTVIDITYRHPKLKGWKFSGSVAGDTGKLYGKNLGFSLRVSKEGIIKKWK